MVVADGHVVLGNVSDVFAQDHPELPGVPAVFGSVREENDIDLKQVRTSTKFDNAAWPFTQEQLVQWGVQLTGDMAFGEKVWHYYKPNFTFMPGYVVPSNPDDPSSPTRQRWSMLSSDMRTICGNIYLSQQLSRGQRAPVYSYVFTHRPQKPVTSHLNGWPAWIDEDSSQYAFHMWDQILLFNKTAGFHKKDEAYDSYVFTSLDFAVADRFRSALLEFGETGQIANWTPMKPDAHAVCNIASDETFCDTELKKKECALFNSYGVSYSNWNVN